MKRIIITLALIAGLFTFTGCESWQRNIKSIKSDLSGGLNRIVTVYDYNGQPIKSWEGKFDVRETSSNYVYIDRKDGTKVVICGGIIINEEIKNHD